MSAELDEIIENCAKEIAKLCENSGNQLARMNGVTDPLAGLTLAFALATRTAVLIQEKIVAMPGGEEWMASNWKDS